MSTEGVLLKGQPSLPEILSDQDDEIKRLRECVNNFQYQIIEPNIFWKVEPVMVLGYKLQAIEVYLRFWKERVSKSVEIHPTSGQAFNKKVNGRLDGVNTIIGNLEKEHADVLERITKIVCEGKLPEENISGNIQESI